LVADIAAWHADEPGGRSALVGAAARPALRARVAEAAAARLACTLVDASFAAAVEPTRAPAHGWLMVAECAGDEAAVAVDVAALHDRFGAFDASPNALARVREGRITGAAVLVP